MCDVNGGLKDFMAVSQTNLRSVLTGLHNNAIAQSFISKSNSIIAIVAALVFVFSFAACRGGDKSALGTSNPYLICRGDDKPVLAALGTSGNPYLIGTAEAMADLAERVNTGQEPPGLHYKLTADIDLSAYGANYKAGKGWKPIGGMREHPFKGHFDGDGKKISNLYIDDKTPDDGKFMPIGLFSVIQDGTVKNLVVEDAQVHASGGHGVGGIVGFFGNGNISNCYVTGKVSGKSIVGGLAGKVKNSRVTNCYAAVEVNGTFIVGGLVGMIETSNMSNCNAVGEVKGTNAVGEVRVIGGIAGFSSDSNSSNCYATGTVSGTDSIGGLMGTLDNSYVNNCYATGMVSGGSRVGGLVGGIFKSGDLSNCVALNPAIKRDSGFSKEFGRVVGSPADNAILTNNAALGDMTMPKDIIIVDDQNNLHGVNITMENSKLESSYKNMGWAFGDNDDNPWKWGGASHPLPVLYWQ